MMWRLGRRKEPKALTSQEDTGPAGASKVSKGTNKENYGLFTLHNLPQEVAYALECVLNSCCHYTR